MAWLIGMSEEVKGQKYELVDNKVTIGRSGSNDIRVDHNTISSRHCCITCDNKQFILADLGSTNGTRVNSREVTETALKPKDLVQVGSLEFLFDAEEMEVENTDQFKQTQVQISTAQVQAPVRFENLDPNADKGTVRKVWFFIIGLIAVLALAVVVLFLYRLLSN